MVPFAGSNRCLCYHRRALRPRSLCDPFRSGPGPDRREPAAKAACDRARGDWPRRSRLGRGSPRSAKLSPWRQNRSAGRCRCCRGAAAGWSQAPLAARRNRPAGPARATNAPGPSSRPCSRRRRGGGLLPAHRSAMRRPAGWRSAGSRACGSAGRACGLRDFPKGRVWPGRGRPSDRWPAECPRCRDTCPSRHRRRRCLQRRRPQVAPACLAGFARYSG